MCFRVLLQHFMQLLVLKNQKREQLLRMSQHSKNVHVMQIGWEFWRVKRAFFLFSVSTLDFLLKTAPPPSPLPIAARVAERPQTSVSIRFSTIVDFFGAFRGSG